MKERTFCITALCWTLAATSCKLWHKRFATSYWWLLRWIFFKLWIFLSLLCKIIYYFSSWVKGKGNVDGEGKPAERERFLLAESWRICLQIIWDGAITFLLGFQKKQYPLFYFILFLMTMAGCAWLPTSWIGFFTGMKFMGQWEWEWAKKKKQSWIMLPFESRII